LAIGVAGARAKMRAHVDGVDGVGVGAKMRAGASDGVDGVGGEAGQNAQTRPALVHMRQYAACHASALAIWVQRI